MILALTLVHPANAAPPTMVQTEVNHLLGFVGGSGCEFYRNGIGYDSTRAQAHLRMKYQWLAARDQVKTAEDFIEKAATRSSLSGKAYTVRCGNGKAIMSNLWLRDELIRYRTPGSQ
jgi:hypothetical protein